MKILRNSILSFTLNLATKAANVIVFIWIARRVGAESAGAFSLATTFLLIFTSFTVGLDELLVRQVAQDRSTGSRYLGSFFALRLLFAGALYGVMWLLTARLIGYAQETRTTILIMGLSLIPDSLGLVGQALLTAHEKFAIPAGAAFLTSTLKLLGAGYALSKGWGLGAIAGVWVGAAWVGAAVVLGGAARASGVVAPRVWFDRSFWGQHLRLAWPFLVIGFLLTLEYQTDVVLLSVLRSEAEVGWYSAATTIAFSLMLLPSAYRTAIYPAMARYQKNEPEKLGRLFDISFVYLGAAALPMVVGIMQLAPQLVVLLYKDDFQNTVLPLQIMIASLVFNFLNIPSSRLLLVNEQQARLSHLLGGSLAVNIALNLALDPWLGAVGAAIARLCSTLTFFLPNYWYVIRHYHPHNFFKALARPTAAVTAMAGGVWLVREMPLEVSILSGAMIYLTVLLALKGLPGLEKGIMPGWLGQRK